MNTFDARVSARITQELANTHQSIAASGKTPREERAAHAARAAAYQRQAAMERRALREARRAARASAAGPSWRKKQGLEP